MNNKRRLKSHIAKKRITEKPISLETMSDFAIVEVGAENPAYVKGKNSETPITDLLNMPLEEMLDNTVLDPDVKNTITQEIKQQSADRFHFSERIVDCPDGRLFKFIGDFDNDDPYESLPTCMATITFRLPSTFWDMISFNQNMFDAENVVTEIVRGGQLELGSLPIRDRELLIELYLEHPLRYQMIDTVSVYLEKDGKIVKPIVSLYNITKIHRMNMLVNFHEPFIKLIFEMDAGVNPQRFRQVLWAIRRTITWRLSNVNWHGKYPLDVGAWSYFQVTLQPLQRNFFSLYHALDIALAPLLAAPASDQSIYKFPFTLDLPYRLPGCPSLIGPVTVERITRGPVIRA